ncbi:Allergen Fus c 3 [Fusarium austroafricanum]|uniref:Allergen Fus c 3 n=1 Tax=Fusarium austroafricanum TaxID=2364996 RepID=A0A8H4NW94_9HYPO|nr:Allergen Fus c 3 [Fusarium austroafricanum]
MAAHTITVEPGELSWDRRNSGRESTSASHFLYQLSQEEESPVEVADSVLGDASWRIGPYHPVVSTFNSSLAGPLLWDTTTSHIGTSDSDEFSFDPGIPMRSESSEFDWCSMTHDKGLIQGHREKSPTATSVSLQTDGIEDVSKTSPPAKMRSASRKPKNFRGRSSIPADIRQARESHNNVEKQYRTRLKYRFERLLSALQASMPKNESKGEDGSVRDPYCFSRGEVLDVARQRILTLEEENKRLATRVEMLSRNFMIN